MRSLKILTVVGARPQFIKAAMVSRAIVAHNAKDNKPLISEEIVHTGQHYDKAMSQVFFDDLKIPAPTVNLNINGTSHGQMTGQMLSGLEAEMLKRRPDWVLIYGDTNSTLAAALAAAKLHIPIAHVEAGLRSFNRKMPEEINRLLSDEVSRLLFCPTRTAVANLVAEGFSDIINDGLLLFSDDIALYFGDRPKSTNNHKPGIVANVGDVMHDAALVFGEIASRQSVILNKLQLVPRQYLLVTVHRAENTDDPQRLAAILKGLESLSKTYPVVFPVHPRTAPKIAQWRSAHGAKATADWHLIPPVSFLDMIRLEQSAAVILTDSGGVQKEAYFHQVPCVTLRDETEWQETLQAGWNQLAGADVARIVACCNNATAGSLIQEYGNGSSAESIVAALASMSII